MNRTGANKTVFRRAKFRMVLIAAVVGLLAAISAVGMAAFLPSEPQEEPVIMEVGGLPVTEAEFLLYMDKERGAVTNYFNVTYGAEDSEAYWTETFGAERPIDKLKQQAMNEAVKGKTLQLLAVEKGLVTDSSFQSFVNQWEKNNTERGESLDQGQAIFGLAQYDLSQYYFYSLSQLRLDLEEQLGEEALKVTKEEVKDRYQFHAAKFENQTQITFNELSVSYSNEEREAAGEKIKLALKLLDSGTPFEEVGRKYGKDGIRQSTLVLNEQASPLKADSMLKQAAEKLKAGEHSAIIDRGSSFSIIQMINKNEQYAVPIATLESQLQSEVLHHKFERYVAEKVKAVKISINQEAFDRLKAGS
ncbi:PPIC-type PPIASE domain-containing protein [Paenibacillus algorifonticola]|uniref:PPIC-type PPIASE domain-containing protein n=1 Tax=Paenibacillus algorifonticola TaxID=684063 RepID=A0A1I2FKT4_9BACL|nr:peptidylprolyl isomerase [Paenibacillus algorifonticola]SFF05126.1 PPIC-type PPIASE domain-containing protein [Paenibacillus algorifonticola]